MDAYESTNPQECWAESCDIYIKWISTHDEFSKKPDASEITNL
jgi:hypothetical protein